MQQRPFTAASNKYAYAQAFTASTVRRQSQTNSLRQALASRIHFKRD